MSGTHVYYNGVLLRDCETIEMSSVVEYGETQTHERFLKTRITVASTLISIYQLGQSTPLTPTQQHPSTIRIPPVTNDETMVGRAEEILQLLSEPRKDFWYAVNGVGDWAGSGTVSAVPKEIRDGSSYRLILVATGILPTLTPPEPPAVGPPTISGEFVQLLDQNLTVKRVNVQDANNGPKPMGLDARQVFGGNVLRVQATFEVCRVLSKPISDDGDPGYDAQKVRGVIGNTWSVVDGLDDDGAVTHTVSGKLYVKDRRYKANAMRMFAFPLAFPYARLVSRQHTVDETGLVLQYEYVFRHAGAAPPQGVRKYEATYGEEVRVGSSPVQNGFMNIRVMGWHHRTETQESDILPGVAVPVPLLEREKKQKAILLRAAYTILWSRIRGIDKLWTPVPGQKAKNVLLVNASVFERVGLPQLELRVAVKYTAQDNTEFLNRMGRLGEAIDIANYDPRWWPVDNEWGRLPAEDKENPYFDMDAYPYAELGDPDKSDYFVGYFQPPGSNRHTLPRITGVPTNDSDTSMEWAKPGGSVPTGAVESPSSAERPDSTNPIAGPAFTAIYSKNLLGVTVMGPLPPAINEAYSGVSDLQKSGFMYLEWKSEVKTDSNVGKIMLPLSKPRALPYQQMMVLGVSFALESSVAVSLHAAYSKRVYSVSATRFGKWPQIPEPKKQIIRKRANGYDENGRPTYALVCIETLLNKELLTETPELTPDQCDRSFTLHARYTYGMSNPWAGDSAEGGSDFEIIPVGESPMDKATASNNAITIRGESYELSPLFRSLPQYG
jgi:hypothetical protein